MPKISEKQPNKPIRILHAARCAGVWTSAIVDGKNMANRITINPTIINAIVVFFIRIPP